MALDTQSYIQRTAKSPYASAQKATGFTAPYNRPRKHTAIVHRSSTGFTAPDKRPRTSVSEEMMMMMIPICIYIYIYISLYIYICDTDACDTHPTPYLLAHFPLEWYIDICIYRFVCIYININIYRYIYLYAIHMSVIPRRLHISSRCFPVNDICIYVYL